MLSLLTAACSRSAVRENGLDEQNRSSHTLSPRIAPRVPLKSQPGQTGQPRFGTRGAIRFCRISSRALDGQ